MQYRNMKLPLPSPIPSGSISVIGTGTIETKPDIAILTMGVTTDNKSLEEAQNQNDKYFNNILVSLVDYGISKENISTKDISVTRNYDYNTNTFLSYKVSHILSITINDFSKLDDIYSLGIENGANDNITVNFTLSNPNLYYNKALKKASQDAVNKASLLAKSFNVKYNNIPYKVHENSSSLYSITYPTSLSYSYTPNITPGLIKITSEVEATFATYAY